jgi:hypothetical protein
MKIRSHRRKFSNSDSVEQKKILSDLEPLRGSSNKKRLYSTRSYVNWALYGTRGALKRSFNSRLVSVILLSVRKNLCSLSFIVIMADIQELLSRTIKITMPPVTFLTSMLKIPMWG